MINSFRLSISAVPYTDKNSISWGKVKYQQRELTITDFVELVKHGYCFCHCFKSKDEVLFQTEKRDSNFVSAQMVFVDIDDAQIPMSEFVAKLSKQPTAAYTTPNNHTEKSKWLYRFRLCYLFDKPITDVHSYGTLYDSIMQSIGNDVAEFVSKDNCGRKASQQFSGNAGNNVEVITSNNVFTFSDFPFQNNNASLSSSLFVSNGKSKSRNTEVVISDTDFMADVERLSVADLIVKYQYRYSYQTQSALDFSNGYALIPDNYQEIYRSWYTDFFEKDNGDKISLRCVKKVRDGQHRRKKLFIASLIMRKITPSISYENLLLNLIREVYFYYDNSDRVLTVKVLKDIAQRAITIPFEEIHLNSRHKKKFVVDKSYCAECGVKPNAMKNVVRKMLNDAEIGEVYDCSLSLKENLAQFKKMGMKIGKTKLYEWCKENGISPKRNKVMIIEHNPLMELKEVKQRYFIASTKGEKQSLVCIMHKLRKELEEAA